MHKYIIILGFFFCSGPVTAQEGDSISIQLQELPNDFYTKVEKKYASIDKNLTKKTGKYLNKLKREERKFYKKLSGIDSGSAKIVQSSSDAYEKFTNRITNKTGELKKVNLKEYSSRIDTLSTSLTFLNQYKDLQEKVKLPSEAMEKLKANFNKTGEVKAFIDERKQLMKDALAKYTHLPRGLQKQYDRINKTAYYYKAQVKEYREILEDPKKIETAAIQVLNQIPAFQKFMKENSQLASLFRLPDNAGSVQNLSGLQTRASVQNMIQNRIASGGPNAMAQVQQNLSAAHTEMNILKEKLNQVANGGGDPDMPDFVPNNQKTKSFLKRMEYGLDVDFGKNNSFMPGSTAKIAASLGYKLSDKSLAGVGLGYNLGLGSIEHISFSHQGVSLRSFLDWKPFGKGKSGFLSSLWVSGGYEMNHNAGFKNIEQLKNSNAWQRSALLGISKKYKISKKVKGEMKLLYDFLHREHIPKSNALVWRVGYKF
jgi:hypothetical protein